jgi:hypothetical protein
MKKVNRILTRQLTKFSQSELSVILKVTRDILDHLKGGEGRLDRQKFKFDYGLCCMVDAELLKNGIACCGYALVFNVSDTWEHFSGSSLNPIPVVGHIWSGMGLRMRVDFMQHMVKEIETVIEQYTGEGAC